MARSMTKDLTEGKPMKLVLSFAAPLLFGVLFQQFYSFVDTAIVGRYLGAEKLAAVGATGSVNFLVIGLCLGFCSGFAIPIAQAFGAKDEHEVRRCVWHAVTLSAALSTAECHTHRRTSCSFFAPKACAIGIEKPEQKPRHSPITRKFTEPVAPTAASFSAPRYRPTIAVSTKL